MKFFIDSVDIQAIKKFTLSGMVDGVTTNPSIIAKSGKDFKEVIREICEIVPGPVSAEVTATDARLMVEEGLILSKIAKNVAVKVPLTWDGLEACKTLSDKNIMINVTLCFSAQQALLAAKAGATFISPFIGRLDDIGEDGMDLIRDIRTIYDNYPSLNTEKAFKKVDMDFEEYVESSERYFRPNEVDYLLGDYSKAEKELGWTPKTSIDDLVSLMVEEDIKLAKREKILIDEGLLKPTWENPLSN